MERRKVLAAVAATLATPAAKLHAEMTEPESPLVAEARKAVIETIVSHATDLADDRYQRVNLADLYMLAEILCTWESRCIADDEGAILNAFQAVLGRYHEYIVICPDSIHEDVLAFIEERKAALS